MKIRSGCPFYGQNMGILVFSSDSPRIPGDAGHAGTFSYPVMYRIVEGSFADCVDFSEEMRTKLTEACLDLKALGVRGIVADCGLISLYQDALGAHLPFVASSLCQIPTVWQMLGQSGTIGIITGHSGFLKETHLIKSGWNKSIPIAVQGMECMEHFRSIVIEGKTVLDVSRMRQDVLDAALMLKENTPELRAVILECSNLATYSHDVFEALEVPVFDTVSAANLLSYGIDPPRYI